ncbi:hypothetical protein [Kitasatospora sp. NPDC057500]|uniref:hypothetical protein n=1 Tax=Kitasatospora sp. NPDC057500 TaxID=3346151 RepID=UPI00369D5806
MAITVDDIAQADALAGATQYQVSPFFARTPQAQNAACPWHLVALAPEGSQERAAVAWIVANAIMRHRSGRSTAYDLWRSAAVTGTPLDQAGASRVSVCVKPVFGLPTNPSNAADHVPGHVGEWLWYLFMREEDSSDRKVAFLEPPSWSVTEGGGDGFVVHRPIGDPDASLLFRLWEIKKFTGTGSVSGTITDAASQLKERGLEYLAKLCSSHADEQGDVGLLMSQLVELWIQAHPSGGAGVSVSTNTASLPKRSAFTQVSNYLPDLRHPGQLQGLIVAVQDFAKFADLVKEYLWSAL